MEQVLIGFLGGLITGVSPCILPVLPVVFLGGGVIGEDPSSARSRRRPFLVVLGLTLSFAVFTLFGTLVLSLLHLPADLIRWLGLAALVVLGVALIVPPFERLLERPFSRIPQRQVRVDRGGFVLGLALGAVFVPCAGPVLAAITVAGTTGSIGLDTLALTLAFAVGCSIPLLVFALAGRQVVTRVRAFQRHQRVIRIVSGSVMIALAVALALNVTDIVQRYIPNYTEAIGNSLESGIASAGGAGAGPGSLAGCSAAALYGLGAPGGGLGDCGPAPAFQGIEQWLGTPDGAPVDLAALRGKVVLIDFWAYSCINCQRELPHAEACMRTTRPTVSSWSASTLPSTRSSRCRSMSRPARSGSGSRSRSRSTTPTGPGTPTATSPGPRHTSSTRPARSATCRWERATIRRRRTTSGNCSPRRTPA